MQRPGPVEDSSAVESTIASGIQSISLGEKTPCREAGSDGGNLCYQPSKRLRTRWDSLGASAPRSKV